MHLLTQILTLASSRAALPSLKADSIAWKPHLAAEAEAVRRQLRGVDAESFDRALAAESWRRMDEFLRGIEAYRHHPYRRPSPALPVVWEDGSSRLLDYSIPGAEGPAVLVIPSLINRAYVLDLTGRRSFMRWLAAKGLRPFLMDWGKPGRPEQRFRLDDYVLGRLSAALDRVLSLAGRPILAGYCMGGMLGLGLGLARQNDVRGLALLATPWDFSAQSSLVGALAPLLEDAIASCGDLPVDVLQTLFAAIDPGGIERRFRAFAQCDQSSARARQFVAMEDWLNDGVPLAAAVARECLFGWYLENRPASGRWMLGGVPVAPENFCKPALAVAPRRDKIVPLPSALALAGALPHAATHVVEAGHVSMLTGARARADVYAPVTNWLAHMGEP